VWGGCLSAVELCALGGAPRWHHVDCAAAQNPRPA
jgi:hypothetical protein